MKKVAFGERDESCFDEREKGERNFAKKYKQGHARVCIHQLENTIKDANDDLAKVLKETFKREDVVKSHTIIQMSLDRKRVLESILEDLEAKKRLDFAYIFCMNTHKLNIWTLKPYASFGIL